MTMTDDIDRKLSTANVRLNQLGRLSKYINSDDFDLERLLEMVTRSVSAVNEGGKKRYE